MFLKETLFLKEFDQHLELGEGEARGVQKCTRTIGTTVPQVCLYSILFDRKNINFLVY